MDERYDDIDEDDEAGAVAKGSTKAGWGGGPDTIDRRSSPDLDADMVEVLGVMLRSIKSSKRLVVGAEAEG